jgi:transposase, IS5 family
MIKRHVQMSFSSVSVNRRIRKNSFLAQMSLLLDWESIDNEIIKFYKKGKSVDGRPSYSGLLLFKMLLLEYWYGLSDVQTEEMVNENLSAMTFCGLDLEQDVPDHSTLSRFRSELSAQNGFESLLTQVNRQLDERNLLVKKGAAMVDASITDSPRKPKGKTTYEIAQDRKEDQRSPEDQQAEEQQMQAIKKESPGVDTQARWVSKGGKHRFGYKKHIGVDANGMIHAVCTTTANDHDSNGLKDIVGKIPEDKRTKGIFADKGYWKPTNDELLKKMGIKNRIQRKAVRNKPLTSTEIKFNKLISKQRWVVERTFGSIQRWFGETQARYLGLTKTHTQHLLQAICHNLYRAPGLVAANLANTK